MNYSTNPFNGMTDVVGAGLTKRYGQMTDAEYHASNIEDAASWAYHFAMDEDADTEDQALLKQREAVSDQIQDKVADLLELLAEMEQLV